MVRRQRLPVAVLKESVRSQGSQRKAPLAKFRMSRNVITNLDDPRIEVYRHLKTTNLTRWLGRFIAEGKLVVQRLLDSEFAVESVLVSDVREEELRGKVPENVPVYVVPLQQARELVG